MTWTIGEDTDAVSFAGVKKDVKINKSNDYGVPFEDQEIPSVFDDQAHAATIGDLTIPAGDDMAISGVGRIDSLLSGLPMMIAVCDSKGVMTGVNDEVRPLMGYVAKEVVGRHCFDLMTEKSGKLLKDKVFPDFFKTGKFSNVDVSLVHKDGTIVEMMMSAAGEKNAQGRIERSVVVFTDMSQRANAQAALRQSEQRFRESFESATHGMAILTVDGRIAAANVALTDLFGKSEFELSRTRLDDLVLDDDSDKMQGMFDRVMSGQQPGIGAEIRYHGPDDRQIHGLTSVSGVRDRYGKVEQLIVQIVDLTTRHKAEEQLRRAQKMEAIGQLTGGIAHDFNNLLTIIIGNLQLVQRSIKDDEKALKRANEAIEAATKGSDLTRQLLAFARRQSLSSQEINVNDLIGDIETMLKRAVGEKIDFRIDLMDGAPLVEVDATQLESSILNLVINARDAMPKGGSLTIETSKAYLDATYADEHEEVKPGDYVLIAVTDTGSGIPAHVLENIFQPFFTTKEVGKGTGLGLSMVFGFIKQSGGHVKVYSEEGSGTSFKLYLPLMKSGAKDETADSEEVAAPKILVVEDQEAVRVVAVDFLEDEGYQVLQAGNGIEALQILQDNCDIDLLFTDVVMPGGMNGFDLSQAAEQLRPDLKIIHASGYPKGAMVHQEEPRLKDNLITKPYKREELQKIVAETLAS